MLFHMNSKTFEKDFLNNELDQDILEAQYVLVSTRIRISDREKCDNALCLKDALYPDPMVCTSLTDEDLRERYFKQLDDNAYLLAVIVKETVEKDCNTIFLCSHRESKIKYLEYLSEWIYINFGYPCYDYAKYCRFQTGNIKFNKEKVLKKCNQLIKESTNKAIDNMSDEEVRKTIKKLDKKTLKRELKKRDLYRKGMDKWEMREILEIELL